MWRLPLCVLCLHVCLTYCGSSYHGYEEPFVINRFNLGSGSSYSPRYDASKYLRYPPPHTCSEKHIFYMGRHGSREGDNDEWPELREFLNEHLDKIKLSFVRNWVPRPASDAGELVVEVALKEMRHLAQSFKRNFKSLDYPYDTDRYRIRTGSKDTGRTDLTASAFAMSCWPGQPYQTGSPHETDPLLEADNACKAYEDVTEEEIEVTLQNGDVVNLERKDVEAHLWLHEFGHDLIHKINNQMAVDPENDPIPITLDMLLLMYDVCKVETVAEGFSRWCLLFDEYDWENLLYFDDLGDFYGDGPGLPVVKLQAVPLLKTVFNTMDKVIAGEEGYEEQKAALVFGSKGTFAPLMSAVLGLFQDDTLAHDTPRSQWMNRNFRVGNFAHYGSHALFVLYACGLDDYRVLLMHNEAQQRIPGCSSMYCPLEEFRELYRDILELNWVEECGNDPQLCFDWIEDIYLQGETFPNKS